MSIELGLGRITQLLVHLGNPHHSLKVLHVAGTNGKGSVCSYLSSILQQLNHQKDVTRTSEAAFRIGKFTSPHLCHVRDSITVNSKPISAQDYASIRQHLKKVDEQHALQCTEFEIMTATALQYFHQVQCSWCILEVGLGGRQDATNVVPGSNKVCGITKIGLDHEGFLGSNLESIAWQKAGILVPETPFVAVDGTNDPKVLKVVREVAQSVNAQLETTNHDVSVKKVSTKSWGTLDLNNRLPLNGEYQISNVQVALLMLDYLQQRNQIDLSTEQVLAGIGKAEWPGRLQFLNYKYSKGNKSVPVLFDGAHNGSAAQELAKYLDSTFRFSPDEPLTFVIAITKGKTLDPLLAPLIKPQDRVICTRFGAVEGMPWISAMDTHELASEIKKYTDNVSIDEDLHGILGKLAQSGPETKICVCGSLYLVGQLLEVHYANSV